jgi:NAD(P)-dependent dehydrogenase (short-subunit alcohol dehydrogenase family)
MDGFRGKVALVTGGSAGIGLATAIAFAREGADVVIASRNEDRGEHAVRLIKEAGGDAMFVKADVSSGSDVEALIRAVVSSFGRIDMAFNNAGATGALLPLADQTEKDFDDAINVNLKGAFLCMKHEILQMVKQGGGAIVNTSAVAGLNGAPKASVYSAGKHGVLGLTKSAAIEYAKAGIRVNAVCAGVIRTPGLDLTNRWLFADDAPKAEAWWASHVPMRRTGRADEVAQAVLWLCSEAASYVTGSALVVDGGLFVQ